MNRKTAYLILGILGSSLMGCGSESDVEEVSTHYALVEQTVLSQEDSNRLQSVDKIELKEMPKNAAIEDPYKEIKPLIEGLQVAANQGSTQAQIALAKVLLDYAIPEYDKIAFHWLQKAAEAENSEADYYLANCYYEGIGTDVQYDKAYAMYSQLAQNDHYLSQYQLAKMYFYSQGIERDLSQAKKWTLLAIKNNVEEANALADFILQAEDAFEDLQEDKINTAELDLDSLMHFNFEEKIQQDQNAMEWLEYAVSRDNPRAIYLKGMNLLQGKQGYLLDIELGMECIQNAAQKNEILAQYELGRIYELGLFGLMEDQTKAYQWYKVASQNGHPLSKEKIIKMAIQNE